ncbi:hypothetical protein DICVIV_01035 [Dictyocaulus viviparus]|uniref:Uncharacterized protein n=1 Tax=Dictyocaulus viviparus TaxID=29172 RepID=A0A0D8Y7K4_DICVI|nr:hypothetical protein DICVIV_01035 [Dictyocaulus viviparus]
MQKRCFQNQYKEQLKHIQSSVPKSNTTSNISSSISSSIPAEVSPSFTLNPGDVKMVHHLQSGGKLVIQKKKNGDVAYALSCPDGRKVFLEKTKENAVLSLTDSDGHSIKTLACEF